MYKIFLAGVGGFIGSALRYLVSGSLQQWSKSPAFPYGTVAVNLAGCFFIGLLSELAESRGLFSAESRTFVFIGILGGFTTFSTFGNETMNLFRDSENFLALVNIGAHMVLGLGAIWLGRTTAFLVWR